MAAGALVRQGDKGALAAIRETYQNGGVDSIRIGAWLLARVGDESDIPLLRRRIDEAAGDTIIHAYVNHARLSSFLLSVNRCRDSERSVVLTHARTFRMG